MRRTLFVSCLLAGLVPWPSAEAQTTSALPFRPGQWGAEFSVANQTVGTILRFHAPDRAWAFGGSASGNWVTSSTTPPGDRSNAQVSLRAALRRYRTLAPGVVGYGALGASIGLGREAFTNSSRSSFSVGPLAQVGASWFVLPRLSIGADAALTASLLRGREREVAPGPGGATTIRTSTGFGFAAGQFGLVGALYF